MICSPTDNSKYMPAETFTLSSFAKINLLLRILGKRGDGFHEIRTVFQTVSLKDNLTFGENRKVILICNDKTIPSDEGNLIVKAAKKLREKYKIKTGAEIFLEKNIPSPGGLGGGSSNAATALIGLTKLWRIKFNFAELLEIGKTLGSDVPFFFYGGTALGTGRGNEISQMDDLKETHLLIVTPDVSVSTGDAFTRLNAAHLTNKSSKSILQICCDEAKTVNLPQSNWINDFENTVFKIEPEIKRVKQRLLDCNAKQASLSGSGASVFAIFEDANQLQMAFDALKNEQSWRVFIVRTVSRREYQASLNFGDEFSSRR